MIQTWGDSYSRVGVKERFWLWLQWELESESFLVNVNGGISVRIDRLELNWNCDEWNSESWWCMIPTPHIYEALIQV